MHAQVHADTRIDSPDPGGPTLVVDTTFDGDERVVGLAGELDLATRNLALSACTVGDHRSVVVDLAEVTFMDCGGYGAFVAARKILEGRGSSFDLRHPAGQPARLLALIAALEVAVPIR